MGRRYLIVGRKSNRFEFTIDTRQTNTGLSGTSDTFSIPTSKANVNYDWAIDWGDGTKERATGTGANASDGIPHVYATPGRYDIRIEPIGSQTAWLHAFGFWNNTSGANATSNKQKVVMPSSPLTPAMFATNDIASYMFCGCNGVGFTMGDKFGFSKDWDDVTSVGGNFCTRMFDSCSGAAFTMSETFNIPQNIKTSGTNFLSNMFTSCSGAAFTMNSVFNLPTALSTIGTNMLFYAFSGCIGNSFTMNDVFCIPETLQLPTNMSGFLANTFYGCKGSAFQVNDIFKFPVMTPTQLAVATAVKNTFYGVTNPQTKTTAMNIINGNPEPTAAKTAFGSGFPDWNTIPANWRQ